MVGLDKISISIRSFASSNSMNWKKFIMAVVGSAIFASNFSKFLSSKTPLMNDSSALFVTAHPDDEAMFFGPSILHASKVNCTVFLLCLSTGDAEGLGGIRAQEIYNATYLLGIPPSHVRVIDDERLPDSMTVEWDPEVVAEHVKEAQKSADANIVITFDQDGVSGHKNHKQVSKGVLRYAIDAYDSAEFAPFVLQLKSVNILRKYIFTLDGFISRLNGTIRKYYVLLSSNWDYFRVRTSFQKGYESQHTWYRLLWQYFSRYMVVNELEIIDYRGFINPSSSTAGNTEKPASSVASSAASSDTAHEEL